MESSTDQLVERLSCLIARWGLLAPAIAFLEANKPLSFVGSQVLLMLQPITNFFVTRELTDDVVMLLADRDLLEQLVARLETVRSKSKE
jgi:hypothetical protein